MWLEMATDARTEWLVLSSFLKTPRLVGLPQSVGWMNAMEVFTGYTLKTHRAKLLVSQGSAPKRCS